MMSVVYLAKGFHVKPSNSSRVRLKKPAFRPGSLRGSPQRSFHRLVVLASFGGLMFFHRCLDLNIRQGMPELLYTTLEVKS
jgi:hypothetical protein